MAVNSFWSGRPVFVTGGTGLVGSALVRRLLEAHAEPVCLVRDWVPQSELVRSGLLDSVRVVRGHVCDQPLIERTLGEYEIDTVFHLGAQTIVGVANRNPVSTFESNIQGTWTVLEACRRSPKVRQIVTASSDKAYGEQENLPYNEGSPLAGRFPYDCSKSCSDLIAQSYASSFGVPVTVTRCGNFFGGGDLNWNRIVPGTIRSVIEGKPPVIRSDGTFVRDYFYSVDGAASYMLLAECLAADRSLAGHAFNFSNEKPVTVTEMAGTILRLMDSDLRLDIRNEASNEIRRQYLDASKARRLLGWTPLFALEQALVLTIRWYRDFFSENAADTVLAVAGTHS